MFRIESVEREGGKIDMLPLPLCYVEVWPTYQRLFRYPPRPNLVKVCNDHGETARLFRLLREQPQALLTALTRNVEGDLLPEVLCYQRLITAWHLIQQTKQESVPTTVEALKATLVAPYQRLRTVLFEALEWRACLERYNDPRALLILEPPWKQTEQDEWAALQLRLARSYMQWRLVIPRDIFVHQRFPATSCIAQEGDTIWLAPLRKASRHVN